MSPVYTTRFILSFLDDTTAAYTVPAGKVAVVTCIAGTVAGGSGDVEVIVELSGQPVWLAHVDATSQDGAFLARGLTLPLSAGEVLSVSSSAATYVALSGWLLTSV